MNQPHWVCEYFSGYAGWRCQTCGTWIYDGESYICDCLGNPPERENLQECLNYFERISSGLIDPVDLEIIKYTALASFDQNKKLHEI